MGEIVAAMATVHAPQLITRPPSEDPAQLDAGIAAMGELGKLLDETKADVMLIIGIDHLETFFPHSVPTFAMITGDKATAEYAGQNFEIPIHQPLAKALLNGLTEDGIDMTYALEGLLGHAFATPFKYLHQGRSIPVVPMLVNVYLPPLPSLERCVELGRKIARIVADRPERVAIVASGGMSHYPGTWKYYSPEYDFDYWMIQEMEEGRPESLIDMTCEQLDEVGNTELLPWAIMFGAIGKVRGELLSYQPTSHHGHAVFRFIPDRGRRGREHQDLPKYGGFEFKGQGYEFYKYPEPEAYPLNKALYALRTDAALRERFFADMDGVIRELGLTKEQGDALKTVNTDNVVAQGAHGILAITSIVVLQSDQRRLQAASG